MSTTQHTPGPWIVSRESNGTHIRNAIGGLVASMEAGSQSARDRDAPLIAAAPELLESLRAVLAVLEQPVTRNLRMESSIFNSDIGMLERFTRAAIAKATGA